MTTLEALRNALASIVAIVEQEGELQGRVRLQKLGYLLQQRGFQPLASTRFSYHHYGPYSDQLAGALEQAVVSGLVEEVQRDSSTGRKLYTYKLNRAHPDYEHLDLPDADVAEVQDFMKSSKDAHWRTLELAATVVYLERSLPLSREAATNRALGLKPDCKPYVAPAAALLSELGFSAPAL